MKKKIIMIGLVIIVCTALISACGQDNNSQENGADDNADQKENDTTTIELGQKELSLPYVSWATAIASANVAKVILEDVGYEIDLKQVEPGALYSGIASGSADFNMGSVTLPNTHADYWDEYGDDIVDIGKTLEDSVTMGLTVPEYVDIDSIKDMAENTNGIGDKVNWKIVGIDPGSGQMNITENDVMPGYGLDAWTLQSSSGAGMTAELKRAIDAKEPIIVTLWEPHWAFIEWDLRYLDDPDNLFGDADSKHAVARKGFKEDAPAAYKILERFEWTAEDMGEVMDMTHKGMEAEEAARKWVEDNQSMIAEWTKDIE
ncbi:Glycine betaine-binding protein OpuAC [Lentibacillus sp. JNUCC-1]|uniref:glycine betaine ABC transporter substrate-binding protein n=1 Tax=Lentibacillus sp. JNUCC-1 TaxID=2654513 RepID=UPI00132480A0|nr:glycine betaine ABC transporter substrate-binding protein [Lentibacillus sp. JNUCC-1]MUV37788.1 Glycine betaine-binding protein OpuAC [Lentibacillus sp. JNUCC-1]